MKYYNTNFTSKNLAEIYGSQYIYQYFLGTKILHPENIKNIYTKISNNDVQKCILENFDFNRLACSIVIIMDLLSLNFKFILNLI